MFVKFIDRKILLKEYIESSMIITKSLIQTVKETLKEYIPDINLINLKSKC
jgi:hypothetical protein